MNISTINGPFVNGSDPFINGPFIGCGIGAAGKGKAKVNKFLKKVETGAKNTVKKVETGAKNTVKKAAPVVKKAAIASPRNAFLGLVLLNFRGFATKLKAKDFNKVSKVWKNLGGDPKILKQNIDKGAQKKPILGPFIGEPVLAVVGGTLAVAAPVIAALNEFLKESKDLKNTVIPKKITDQINTNPGGGSGNGGGNVDTGGGSGNGGENVDTGGGSGNGGASGNDNGDKSNKNDMIVPLLIWAGLLYFAFK